MGIGLFGFLAPGVQGLRASGFGAREPGTLEVLGEVRVGFRV